MVAAIRIHNTHHKHMLDVLPQCTIACCWEGQAGTHLYVPGKYNARLDGRALILLFQHQPFTTAKSREWRWQRIDIGVLLLCCRFITVDAHPSAPAVPGTMGTAWDTNIDLFVCAWVHTVMLGTAVLRWHTHEQTNANTSRKQKYNVYMIHFWRHVIRMQASYKVAYRWRTTFCRHIFIFSSVQ